MSNTTILSDPRDMQLGDHISFMYHHKERVGHVKEVGRRHFVIEHDDPSFYDGRRYSSYNFLALGSKISVL